MFQRTAIRLLPIVAASVCALGLAACDQKPSVDRISTMCGPVRAFPASSEDASNSHRDVALLLKVRSALQNEPSLKSYKLDVGVLGGVITLYGRVDTSEHRVRAAQIAQNVDGVQAVKTGIAVTRGS